MAPANQLSRLALQWCCLVCAVASFSSHCVIRVRTGRPLRNGIRSIPQSSVSVYKFEAASKGAKYYLNRNGSDIITGVHVPEGAIKNVGRSFPTMQQKLGKVLDTRRTQLQRFMFDLIRAFPRRRHAAVNALGKRLSALKSPVCSVTTAVAALVYMSTFFAAPPRSGETSIFAGSTTRTDTTRTALALATHGGATYPASAASSSACADHSTFNNFLSQQPCSNPAPPLTPPKHNQSPKSYNGQKYPSTDIVIVTETHKTLKTALLDLYKYMQGPKADTLLLLLATSLVPAVCKQLNTSPILGFLLTGMTMGPNALGLISGIHTTEILAELGIVFFLFEMGIELSLERLRSMKKDVFGLGLSQFISTTLAVFAIGSYFQFQSNALVVLGAGVALSSSAFVLQLLKDKNQLATRFGKAAFGILLLQDLAVVPLLVVTPLLATAQGATATGTAALGGLAAALGSAVLKAGMALGSITFLGRFILNPLFQAVAAAKSHEAFLGTYNYLGSLYRFRHFDF